MERDDRKLAVLDAFVERFPTPRWEPEVELKLI
jgi:hypothetical protein